MQNNFLLLLSSAGVYTSKTIKISIQKKKKKRSLYFHKNFPIVTSIIDDPFAQSVKQVDEKQGSGHVRKPQNPIILGQWGKAQSGI